MDFDETALRTRQYNFHSHTEYCDGRATMDEFARAAVDAGFLHYGFSPHSPVPIVSPCNMSMDDVDRYTASVSRLQKQYDGRIHFYTSMEIDYLGPHWGPAQRYFRNLPLDYRIGSVHFIPSQSGPLVDIDGSFDSFSRKMTLNFRGDIHYVVNCFFDQSEQMILRGGFDIIGHLDKIAQNASLWQPGIDSEPWFEQRVGRLIEMAVSAGLAIEINTKAYAQHSRLFPDPKWFPLLKRLGATTVVNSDAHRPELIDASRDLAFRLLDNA